MTNSILLTVKKLLGISEEYHAFDIDILTNINAVFLTLNQLGIGPILPFQLPLIVDADDEDDPAIATTWDDFLGDQKEHLAAVQTYVYQRVRLLFDPPTNSFLVDAIRKSCDEFEWRFTVQPKTAGAVNDVEARKTVYAGDDTVSEEEPFEPVESTPPGESTEPNEPFIPGSDEDTELGNNLVSGPQMTSMRSTRSSSINIYDIFGK